MKHCFRVFCIKVVIVTITNKFAVLAIATATGLILWLFADYFYCISLQNTTMNRP